MPSAGTLDDVGGHALDDHRLDLGELRRCAARTQAGRAGAGDQYPPARAAARWGRGCAGWRGLLDVGLPPEAILVVPHRLSPRVEWGLGAAGASTDDIMLIISRQYIYACISFDAVGPAGRRAPRPPSTEQGHGIARHGGTPDPPPAPAGHASAFVQRTQAAGFDLTPVPVRGTGCHQAQPRWTRLCVAEAIATTGATIGGVIERLEQKVARRIVSRARPPRLLNSRSPPKAGACTCALLPIVRGAQDDILEGLSARDRARFVRLARKALQAPDAGPPADGTARCPSPGAASHRPGWQADLRLTCLTLEAAEDHRWRPVQPDPPPTDGSDVSRGRAAHLELGVAMNPLVRFARRPPAWPFSAGAIPAQPPDLPMEKAATQVCFERRSRRLPGVQYTRNRTVNRHAGRTVRWRARGASAPCWWPTANAQPLDLRPWPSSGDKRLTRFPTAPTARGAGWHRLYGMGHRRHFRAREWCRQGDPARSDDVLQSADRPYRLK